ncbi:MAG: cadherin-like domain-containing protein [Rhodoglobus sp.]
MPSPLSAVGRFVAVTIGIAGIAGAGIAAVPAFADNSVNAFAVSDIYTMTQGETLTVSDPGLLLNDTTTSGGELEVQSIQGNTSGLTLNSGNKGGFTFSPDPSFNGAATFEYVLIEINTATTSDPTSVVIIVNPAPGQEGNDPDPAPCEVSQSCGGDGTGTAGSGLDDPCAPADPNAPQTPADATEAPGDGAPECPLPPCDPDAPEVPIHEVGQAGEPTCIPIIPPCDPNGPITTPENAPDCVPVIPPCDPNALPTTPENAPGCIPIVPPCDPHALPTTPENATDCIPADDPDPVPEVPCAAGTPDCDPTDVPDVEVPDVEVPDVEVPDVDVLTDDIPTLEISTDLDAPIVINTVPVVNTPSAQPSPTSTTLAHTGSRASGLGGAGLLLLLGGLAAIVAQRRRAA